MRLVIWVVTGDGGGEGFGGDVSSRGLGASREGRTVGHEWGVGKVCRFRGRGFWQPGGEGKDSDLTLLSGREKGQLGGSWGEGGMGSWKQKVDPALREHEG